MADTLNELRARYEDFLRGERYNLIDRVTTAVDDYLQRSAGDSSGGANGKKAGGRAVSAGDCPRLRIGLTELRSEFPRLAERLRYDPLRHLRALEVACHGLASEERPGYDKDGVRIKVSIAGPIGAAPSSPRSLASSSLRQLVCVEGVATKVSAIKPKVVKSVHFCPQTQQHEARQYVDATDPQLGLPVLDSSGRELPDTLLNITTSVYPTKNKDGHALETEFGLSVYKDHQTITLQEMPERAPMGQLPRSVELILDHDLVDRIKPGDRVQIVGVYRALATGSSGQSTTSGLFKTVVLVNNVQILGRDVSNLIFSPQDVRMIRSLSKRTDILSILGRSIAPSIHGHAVIKKSLALQLLSGCEKNLANGTHLRGDINILMVGDPSTAKSQLLRAAMSIAPLAVSTTGKGSSGVGLTAAVTSDPDTKERRLEAGAMVLGDRGLVCVDEFDKMNEADRVTIHEAMEQQTVTIAKAGIHASLNARCSVLAAANPVWGQYDRRRRIQENIGLPDSLLSRFDLLFVVLDQLDPEIDRMISQHVILGHQYRSLSGQSGHDTDGEFSDSEGEGERNQKSKNGGQNMVWQRSGYRRGRGSKNGDPHSDDILQHDFLRKYLHFAKTRMKPVLTDNAREYIAGRYAEMRSRQDERTLPVTARSLETVIRLSTAHAKARLSATVEADPDCTVAMDILGFALHHETNHGGNDNAVEPRAPVQDPKTTTSRLSASRDRVEDAEERSDPKRARLSGEESARSDVDEAKRRIWVALQEASDGQVDMADLERNMSNQTLLKAAANALESEGRIMVSDGTAYLID